MNDDNVFLLFRTCKAFYLWSLFRIFLCYKCCNIPKAEYKEYLEYGRRPYVETSIYRFSAKRGEVRLDQIVSEANSTSQMHFKCGGWIEEDYVSLSKSFDVS